MARQQEGTERFPGTGGLTMPVVGGALIGLLVVASVVDGIERFDVPVLAGALLAAVVVWLVFVRPGVRVEGDALVLRGSLGETAVPLAAIERVTITRMLVVQAGARRHVSTALSRTLRSTMLSGGVAAPRSSPLGPLGSVGRPGRDEAVAPGAAGPGGPAAESAHDALGRSAYPDFVEERLAHLADAARVRAGIRPMSEAQEALAADVRRVWSPVALGALGGSAAVFVLSLLLT